MILLKKSHLLVLTILISFASFSAVLFTPALPSLAIFFQISDSEVQWAITLYLIGYAIGQLPYGPLANRIGRKKALFAGLLCAFIGCILCFLAPQFWILCIGRFLQSLGAAAGLKLTYTMIGDCYEGSSAIKIISWIALSFSIAPGIAIALGGFLVTWIGWRGCFLFLSAYTIGIGCLCSFLPETGPAKSLTAFHKTNLWEGLLIPLKNKPFILSTLIYGLTTSLIYVFSSQAPFIGIQEMGLTPSIYGLWGLLPSSGLAIGLFFTGSIAHHWSSQKGLLSGILLMFLGICFLTVFLTFSKTPAALFLPMIIVFAGVGITGTFAVGKILSNVKDKSNTSAMMGFLNVGSAALFVFLITPLTPLSTRLLVILLYAILAIAAFLLFYLKKIERSKNSK